MTWQRNKITGHYYAAPQDEKDLLYMIKRTPYGKSGYTFEVYVSSPLRSDAEWTRIPLSFFSRLKDATAKAEKHLEENPV